MDAAERLDSRTQMKYAKHQFAQYQRDLMSLRREPQVLNTKPADPAIGLLRSDLDNVTRQQSTMQPRVSAALQRAIDAREEVQTLTAQVETMRTAGENMAAKEQLDALALRVDTLESAKEHLRRAARRMTNTVTALEEKMQTIIDKPSDPTVDTLRADLEEVVKQQLLMQTSLTAAEGLAVSATETTQTFSLQMTKLRVLINTIDEEVDAMDSRLTKIPV